MVENWWQTKKEENWNFEKDREIVMFFDVICMNNIQSNVLETTAYWD